MQRDQDEVDYGRNAGAGFSSGTALGNPVSSGSNRYNFLLRDMSFHKIVFGTTACEPGTLALLGIASAGFLVLPRRSVATMQI
jgi:hypothetical protein